MSRLSGVLQQPGPERGEGHQWERRGGGSDLLSAETGGGGKRGTGHGGPGVGPSDRATEKAGPTWDQRDAVQPALQMVLSVSSGAMLGAPHSLCSFMQRRVGHFSRVYCQD